ncbi:hydroxyphenylacetyl-CoA thioesterase PaaI [Kocuria coralli]|uniref:Hydroxyphenylacetyl-CoA thioesterase PaaI n=1 Tax=Kocuria coralli TaxID=1461025 RepID=A0A5J5KZV7_9MICC|nr:hydroxyphenylacetyl-CoA thioesterase PaaI [Kocuria coralli]KAA9394326.1 hydroxyphenylacetyl-CoA thioesterase PaaI [Kocuria coralli]
MGEHKILANDSATRWMGMEVVTAEPGHAVVRMTVREEMTNGFGISHGGMIFTLADTCFALTCNHPVHDDGTVTVASGVDINFLAPTRAGDVLEAEGRLIQENGRSGICDITVTHGETVIALFRGRHRTIPAARKA